jgi:hypothetical protein
MSTGLLWLLVIFLIPLVGFYLLRINASLVFLSLCLGYVLLSFESRNSNSIAANLAKHHYAFPVHLSPSAVTVNLLLLLGPAVLSIILQFRSVAKHYRLLNVIPSLAVSLFAPILIVPLLPTNIMLSIMNNSYWLKLIRYQSSIVGFGSLVAIIFFWLLVYNKRKGSKKHSK